MTVQSQYEKSLDERLKRAEKFRRLSTQAAAGTIAGRPSMVTATGLVVPKGWSK